jgi:hypothetical protein
VPVAQPTIERRTRIHFQLRPRARAGASPALAVVFATGLTLPAPTAEPSTSGPAPESLARRAGRALHRPVA